MENKYAVILKKKKHSWLQWQWPEESQAQKMAPLHRFPSDANGIKL